MSFRGVEGDSPEELDINKLYARLLSVRATGISKQSRRLSKDALAFYLRNPAGAILKCGTLFDLIEMLLRDLLARTLEVTLLLAPKPATLTVRVFVSLINSICIFIEAL